MEQLSDASVKERLAKALLEREGKSGSYTSVNDQEFKTVSIQLKAYGLIKIEHLATTKGGVALFWSLTAKGEQLMIESRVIRESD